MAEQDGDRAVPLGGRVQGRVAGIPGGGLGAALAADPDGDRLDRVEAELAQPVGDLVGPLGGARLEAVVDGDGADPQTDLGGLEGGGDGERHGVRAAADGDQDQRRAGRGGGAGQPGRVAVGVADQRGADGGRQRGGGHRHAGDALARLAGRCGEGGATGGEVGEGAAYGQAYRGYSGVWAHGGRLLDGGGQDCGGRGGDRASMSTLLPGAHRWWQKGGTRYATRATGTTTVPRSGE